MKRSIKKISITALEGILCLNTATCAFAATGTKFAERSELSQCKAELVTQRANLKELITESKQLTISIMAAQLDAKAAGNITKTSRNKLAEMSQNIKAKRQELTIERANNKSLRSEAKEARLAGDYTLAKEKLLSLEDTQHKQIEIRTDLIALLNNKLDYLKSLNNGTSDQETDTIIDTTDTAIGSETSEILTETTVSENNAETTVSGVTDESIIDAAFDDGAELELEADEADLAE